VAKNSGASGGVATLSGGRDAAGAAPNACASRSSGAKNVRRGRAPQAAGDGGGEVARGQAATPPPGISRLTAELPCGTRVQAGGCCLLRVRNIDLGRAQIIVRAGKRDPLAALGEGKGRRVVRRPTHGSGRRRRSGGLRGRGGGTRDSRATRRLVAATPPIDGLDVQDVSDALDV